MIDPVALTQDLVRFRTVNPPGDEAACLAFLADLLERLGFEVHTQAWAAGRSNVVARLAGADPDARPLAFTGHLDTVSLGATPWSIDPFGGTIVDGRLYGRGACDMKAGVAAIVAAVAAAPGQRLRRGVTLVFTSGEETGCQGAAALVAAAADRLGPASGLVVAEPTANRLVRTHKGCLCLRVRQRGLTAHAAAPHLGRNAIYAAARQVGRLATLQFDAPSDPLLGAPTLNVGTISGGHNTNAVPDLAEFTVDLRSTPWASHARLRDGLLACLEDDAELETLIDVPAVSTPADDALVATLRRLRAMQSGEDDEPGAVAFYTDASRLQPHWGCPVVVLGPGDPDLAHQTDESCDVLRIEAARALYAGLIQAWCGPG